MGTVMKPKMEGVRMMQQVLEFQKKSQQQTGLKIINLSTK